MPPWENQPTMSLWRPVLQAGCFGVESNDCWGVAGELVCDRPSSDRGVALVHAWVLRALCRVASEVGSGCFGMGKHRVRRE
eukprot:9738015-Alexandrium_andersonii.AAC.1